jgi:hypothetical protein
MNPRSIFTIAAILCLAFGCAKDANSGSSNADSGTPDRGIATVTDGGTEPDGTVDSDGATESDATNISDGTVADRGIASDGGLFGPDMSALMPDMMVPIDVDSCASACDRYDTCGRTEEVFGSREGCIGRCERITREGNAPAENWWRCATSESCNLLHLCPVPAVDPLECDEICGLVDQCEVGIEFPDCPAACTAGEGAFQTCAENLYGVCNNGDFEACLARDVYTGCQQFCGPAVECNVVREEGCIRDCVQAFATADPLTMASHQRKTQCVRTAGMDCAAMDDCLQPFSFDPPALVQRAAWCVAYNQCDFGFPADCNDGYDSLLASAGAPGLTCALNTMQQACPDFFFQLEDTCENAAQNLVSTACNRYCGAQNLCEVLEGDVPACNNACLNAFTDDPDANERVSSEIRCISETTCPTFTTCLDGASPDGQCQRYCDSLAACGVADENCVADCDANWPRDRHENLRACVTEAGDDCDAVNACALSPTIPCPDACARLAECGVASERCETACDDLHVREPVETALQIGCILAAPTCLPEGDLLSVQACLENPEAAGRACLNFCRAATECNPAADLSPCLTRCVAGFGDGDGLRFAQGQACLDMAARDAACPVLDACIPDEPEVDCQSYCTQLGDCRIDAQDCMATCMAEPPIQTAGCVADAIRTGQQCGGVATCLAVEHPAASDACINYCAYQKDCDRAFDPYVCQLDCTPDPAHLAARNACFSASGCQIEDCLALDGTISNACENACLTGVACGAFADANECGTVCSGRAASPLAPVDLTDRINACLLEARTPAGCDADAAAQCFEPAFCEAVPDVIFAPPGGGRIQYDTRDQPSAGRHNNCGGGGGQQVVVVTIQRRSNASFSIVEHDYDPLIALRSACDDIDSEAACNDDSNGLASRIPRNEGTIVLEPGSYYLYLDGFSGREGTGTVEIVIQPIGG